MTLVQFNLTPVSTISIGFFYSANSVLKCNELIADDLVRIDDGWNCTYELFLFVDMWHPFAF